LCRACLQTYALTQSTEPFPCINAPTCTTHWTREFLDKNVTAVFRVHAYRKHREKVLTDRERARLPSTQEDAFAVKEAEALVITATAEHKALQLQSEQIQRDIYRRERKIALAHEVIRSSGARRMPEENTLTYASETVRSDEKKKEKATFVKPCPAPSCKGFLSTAWKCGLCETWTCPDCHDWKGESKERNTLHVCDDGKVATARLLAKEARPCPKCGVSICKIEGCDQMFCTACNTGFNWRSGKIHEGPVHNPHYFEWLRATGRPMGDPGGTAAAAAAAAAARAGSCYGGHDEDYAITHAIRPTLRIRGRPYDNPHSVATSDEIYLTEAWRIMREEEDTERREQSVEEIFRILRVEDLCDKYDNETWPVALQKAEKDAAVRQAKADLRGVYVAGARDLIRQVLNVPPVDKAAIRKQVEELVNYCNICRAEASKRFNRAFRPLVIKERRDRTD
jgi:hypothetical protein